MNQDEKLKMIYDEFAEKLKTAMDTTLSDLITDYLPHAQTDLELNVFSYSRQLIEDFLADRTTYSWHYDMKEIFKDLDSREVRKKMLEEYHEELVNGIIKDQTDEIASLRKRNEWLEEELQRVKNPWRL